LLGQPPDLTADTLAPRAAADAAAAAGVDVEVDPKIRT
jgi:hypothetical protein